MSSRRSLLESLLLSRLPSAFQEVEYIESSGTQYIDAQLKLSEYDTVESIFSSNSLPVGNINLCGSRNSSNVAISHLRLSYIGQIEPYFGSPLNTNTTITANTKYKVKTFAITGEQECFVNDELKITGTLSFSVSGNYNLFIFGLNNNGSMSNAFIGKIYSFKIYDNNILVRDFVPCYRKADNVAGFYDLVNGVFYTNAGTGDFIVGGNV